VIIVSDTTAISSLYKIQQLQILHSLFGAVIIPDQVANELKYFEQTIPSFKWTDSYPWIKTKTAVNGELLKSISENLDEGEAAAIVLSIDLHADILLIDEKLGRKIALERGLNIIGLLGVLELAKRKNLVPAVKPLLNDLREKANFRISEELYHKTILLAGEK
jgi:predicted nucleic acid-binding protein